MIVRRAALRAAIVLALGVASSSAAQAATDPPVEPSAPAARIVYAVHPDTKAIQLTSLTSALSAGVAGGLVAGTVGGSQAQSIGTQMAQSEVRAASERAGQDTLVPDSAPAIAQRIAAALGKQTGATLSDQAVVVGRGEKLRDKISAEDYVVDVETVQWSVIYLLTNMSRYGLFYGATYAIYFPGDKKPRLKGYCSSSPKKTPDSPTGKELALDNYAAVKRMVAAAADRCAIQIETQLARPT